MFTHKELHFETILLLNQLFLKLKLGQTLIGQSSEVYTQAQAYTKSASPLMLSTHLVKCLRRTINTLNNSTAMSVHTSHYWEQYSSVFTKFTSVPSHNLHAHRQAKLTGLPVYSGGT